MGKKKEQCSSHIVDEWNPQQSRNPPCSILSRITFPPPSIPFAPNVTLLPLGSNTPFFTSTPTPTPTPTPTMATLTTLSLSTIHKHHPTSTLTILPSKRKVSLPPLAALPPLLSATADLDTSATTLAVLGGGSVAALAAVLTLTDPEKRRQQQAEEVGGGDKEVVREYFNGTGFQRWKKIYGETEDVNKVQLDIRVGHAKTVDNVIKMLMDEGPLQGVTVCDAGCGTGSLSIPLAKQGARVYASDISAAMVAEAQEKVVD